MESFIARKRASIYLLFICWAGAVAMMHPGFAMMIAAVFQLIAMLIFRLLAHIEGQYMIKAAEAEHGHAAATAIIWRSRAGEIAVTVLLSVIAVFVLKYLMHNFPFLWFMSTQ